MKVGIINLLLTITISCSANVASALTCKLTDVLSAKDIHGSDRSYKFKTVFVDILGNINSKTFQVKQMAFDHINMQWCYAVSGEWRCGAIPQLRESVMLRNAKLEYHTSAKFYLDNGAPIISYSSVAIDNARAPQNQITLLNDVYYFRGKYDCY